MLSGSNFFFYKMGIMQLFSADAIVFFEKNLKKKLPRKSEKNSFLGLKI